MNFPDRLVVDDQWSDLSRIRALPQIDADRLHGWRLQRLRNELNDNDCSVCVLINPISLRYAVDYRCYGLFQSHIPTSYAFVPVDGPVVLHAAYDPCSRADDIRPGRAINYFDGGDALDQHARAFAEDLDSYLIEIGASNRRVAVEYVNPGITLALLRQDFDVVDGVRISERARLIKSADEIECMRWAIAVAEHGIDKLRQCLRAGVSEVQLWGLLNYANLANNGDWHDGRMLASGPRINPWLQEASSRKVEAGDLVGFDTDMIGPFGYCADISRTLFCGPGQPSARQKQLYRLAYAEIQHNLSLVRAGISFSEFQKAAYRQDESFHDNAYTCVVHAVGMSDEYPRINPIFRGPNPYEGTIEAGMVLCIESYVGARGETDGVKLEQQVVVTDDGYEALTTYPFEEALLS